MELEHIAINVEDAVAAAQWYVENLGMRIVRSSDEAPHMHFLADEKGSMIEIYSNTSVDLPDYANMASANLHLAFFVEDMEATRDRLLAAGATDAGEINTTPAGDQLLFLRDPWNVPLQLVTRQEPMI